MFDDPKLKTGTNIGILLLVCVMGVLALSSFNGEFNRNFEYSLASSSLEVFHEDQIISPAVGIDVFLDTTSLSAQNPVDVRTRAYPMKQFTNSNELWKTLPEHMYLFFPGSLKYPLKEGLTGSYVDGWIQLNKSNNPMEYVGTAKIIYQFPGDYNYYVIPQDEWDSMTLEPGYQFLSGNTLETKNGSLNFHVDSSEVTMTLSSNQIFLGLTWVVVGFGIIELRKPIQNTVNWLGSKLSKNQ